MLALAQELTGAPHLWIASPLRGVDDQGSVSSGSEARSEARANWGLQNRCPQVSDIAVENLHLERWPSFALSAGGGARRHFRPVGL